MPKFGGRSKGKCDSRLASRLPSQRAESSAGVFLITKPWKRLRRQWLKRFTRQSPWRQKYRVRPRPQQRTTMGPWNGKKPRPIQPRHTDYSFGELKFGVDKC